MGKKTKRPPQDRPTQEAEAAAVMRNNAQRLADAPLLELVDQATERCRAYAWLMAAEAVTELKRRYQLLAAEKECRESPKIYKGDE